MKTFVISDTHFGDAKIIDIVKRPFNSVEEMDATLIRNWNKVVTDNDLVYILGDFAFKNPEYYLNQLKGRKILVKGNHDNNIKGIVCRHFESTSDYLDTTINNQRYIMCHYPISSWNGAFRGVIHLYGHVHRLGHISGRDLEIPQLPNAYSGNCEFYNYSLVEINKFKVEEG